MFTIGAFAVIFNDKNEILLCHRTDRDMWNLPGGGVENGEAPWEAVVREVKEETGLDVRPTKLLGIYPKPGKGDIVINFLCEVAGGTITLNPEADQIKYFPSRHLPQNLIKKQIERIADALKEPTKPILKNQYDDKPSEEFSY